MSLEIQDRISLVKYWIEKANSTFAEAQKVAEAFGYYSLAANRLYYSLYYAATALFLSDNLMCKTHKGVLVQLHKNYVTTGLLTQDEGRLMQKMFIQRQEGDYEAFVVVTKEDYEEALPQVRKLLDKLIRLNKLYEIE